MMEIEDVEVADERERAENADVAEEVAHDGHAERALGDGAREVLLEVDDGEQVGDLEADLFAAVDGQLEAGHAQQRDQHAGQHEVEVVEEGASGEEELRRHD